MRREKARTYTCDLYIQEMHASNIPSLAHKEMVCERGHCEVPSQSQALSTHTMPMIRNPLTAQRPVETTPLSFPFGSQETRTEVVYL